MITETYCKLFKSLLDSTVWQEPLAIKVVWITILAMKDRDGYVGASVPGLAKRAGVSLEECEEALARFKAPDPYSRTKDNDGRRIEEVDGGWLVLNHEKYRQKMSSDDRREYQRVKQAEYRQRKKGGDLSLRERVNKAVKNDPITKADAKVMREKWGEEAES